MVKYIVLIKKGETVHFENVSWTFVTKLVQNDWTPVTIDE